MNQRLIDPDLYWLRDLPVIGYHIPEHLKRISTLPFKSNGANNATMEADTSERDQKSAERAALRLQRAQEQADAKERNLAERAKETAIRKAKADDLREEASKKRQQEMLEFEAAKAETRRLKNEAIRARELKEAERIANRPKPLTPQEARDRQLERARIYARNHRKKKHAPNGLIGHTTPTPVRWTAADGTVTEYRSVRQCSTETPKSYQYLKQILRAQKSYTFTDGCKIEVIL